jgi:hypothetical protein
VPELESLSVDPRIDEGNGRLLRGSPCIDAGTNTGAPSTDLFGMPRPLDGNHDGLPLTDIGACEWMAR